MFLINRKLVADAEKQLHGVAYGVQASVARRFNNPSFPVLLNGHLGGNTVLLLFKMTLGNVENLPLVNIIILKYPVYILGDKLLMPLVGNTFHQISHFLLHLIRQGNTKILL